LSVNSLTSTDNRFLSQSSVLWQKKPRASLNHVSIIADP
jgi:hypothetical protein